jgi:KaiC/GvpD/RAD55 family RecA-like ATPase
MNPSGETYDLFLSYNREDSGPVEAIAAALQRRGLKVFVDRWYMRPGQPWLLILEESLTHCRAAAIVVGPHGLGRWQQWEKQLAIERKVRKPDFPLIPIVLPGADPGLSLLSYPTWVQLGPDLLAAEPLDILVEAIGGVAVSVVPVGICPYRGLHKFREEDSVFFFGREVFVERLMAGIFGRQLIAVVGASGSGKSSVVYAGLVPRLRQLRDQRVWEVVTAVPGDRPFANLAAAFAPLLPDLSGMKSIDYLKEVTKLGDALENAQLRLRDLVATVVPAVGSRETSPRLLFIADQWEELYTTCRREEVRRRYIDELLDASSHAPLSVVLTVRGEFFGHTLQHRALADSLQGADILVAPMTRDEMARAITEPAKRVGLSFEPPALVDQILKDVGSEPGRLPLLQFVLRELWERGRGAALLQDDYQEMGGVEGAMARRANEVFEALKPAEQLAVQGVFEHLVQSVETGEAGFEVRDLRQRARLDDFGESERQVVARLADARLLVTSRDPVTREATVEVAHEALINNWKRLRAWVDQTREARMTRERLRGRARTWRDRQQHGDLLLRGIELDEAELWLRRRSVQMHQAPDEVASFIQVSRRARRRRRAVAAALVAGIVVGLATLALKIAPLLDLLHFQSVRRAVDASISEDAVLRVALGKPRDVGSYCAWFQPFDGGKLFFLSDVHPSGHGRMAGQSFLLSTTVSQRWARIDESPPTLRSKEEFRSLLMSSRDDRLRAALFPLRPEPLAPIKARILELFNDVRAPQPKILFEGGVARLYATYRLDEFFGLPYVDLCQTTMVVKEYEHGFVLGGAPGEGCGDVDGIYVLVDPSGKRRDGDWFARSRYPLFGGTFKRPCPGH